MPLGLLVMVLFGFLVPEPGIFVSRSPINYISTCGIFFISGLQLQTEEVQKALRAWPAIVFGLVSILVVTPMLAFPFAAIPLDPVEFSQGLALFAAMPTTVSTGVLMTAGAKGNAALALLFSVSTNIIAVLTVPLFVQYIFSSGAGALDPGALIGQLCLTILLPLSVGKALRYIPAVCTLVSRFKLQLKLLSSALLISLPWIMMSRSSAQLHQVELLPFAALLGLGIAMHLVLLVLNYFGARAVPWIALAERKAIVISGSQKTINTAVSVLVALPAQMGDAGLLVLPCLICHFAQTVIDAFLIAQWAKYVDAELPSAAAALTGVGTAPPGTAKEAAGGKPATLATERATKDAALADADSVEMDLRGLGEEAAAVTAMPGTFLQGRPDEAGAVAAPVSRKAGAGPVDGGVDLEWT